MLVAPQACPKNIFSVLATLAIGANAVSLRRGRISLDPPMCSYPAGGQGNFSNAVIVHALMGNKRALSFTGDENGEETVVQCKGDLPDGCAPRAGQNCLSASCPCESDGALDFPYMKNMVQQLVPQCQAAAQGSDQHPFRVLLVGLGGGALPRYILDHCPAGTQVESVEYDPRVIDAANRFFGLHLEPGVNQAEQGEGGEAVAARAARGEKYDVVLVDAFEHEGKVPESCRSADFTDNLRRILRPPNGMVMQNIQKGDFETTMPVYQKSFGQDSVSSMTFQLGVAHLIIAELPLDLNFASATDSLLNKPSPQDTPTPKSALLAAFTS